MKLVCTESASNKILPFFLMKIFYISGLLLCMTMSNGAFAHEHPIPELSSEQTQLFHERDAIIRNLINQSDYRAALPHAESLYEFSKKNLTVNNWHRMSIMSTLSLIYDQLGDGEKSNNTLHYNLNIFIDNVGLNNPQTMVFARDLLDRLRSQNNYIDALSLHNELVDKSINIYGVEDEFTISLIQARYELERLKEKHARDIKKSTAQLDLFSEVTGGTDEGSIAFGIQNEIMSYTNFNMGDAPKLIQEKIEIFRGEHGDVSPQVLYLQLLLAIYHGQFTNINAADEQYSNVMRTAIVNHGIAAEITRRLNERYADFLYSIQRDYNRAHEIYQSVLKSEDNNQENTLIQQKVAGTLLGMGNYNAAIAVYTDLLQSTLTKSGEYTDESIQYLENIFFAHSFNGDAVAAESAYKKFINEKSIWFIKKQQELSQPHIAEVVSSQANSLLGFVISTFKNSKMSNADKIIADAVLRLKGIRGEYLGLSREADIIDSLVRRLEITYKIEEVSELDNFRSNQDRYDWEDQLEELREELADVERQLSRAQSEIVDSYTPLRWMDISDALGNNSILIDIVRYFDLHAAGAEGYLNDEESSIKYGAVVFLHGESPIFVEFGEAKKIDDLIQEIVQKINSDSFSDDRQAFEKARLEIFSTSIGKIIKNYEVEEIFLSVDGSFHFIPFQIMRPSVKQSFLSDQYHIRVLRSSRALVAARGSDVKPRKALLGVGGVDYGPLSTDGSFLQATDARLFRNSATQGKGWAPLTGAEAEIDILSSMFQEEKFDGITILKGRAASEQSFQEKVLESNPSIIHIATHGTVAAPEYSGNSFEKVALVFADSNLDNLNPRNDGILRGSDIVNMNLSSVQLVTLSACESGVADYDDFDIQVDYSNHEGILSLAYAFRIAGAHNVLMSYWKVNDEATKRFMVDFYQSYFDNKDLGFSGALLEVQRDWSSRGEPFFHWGAFSLIENYNIASAHRKKDCFCIEKVADFSMRWQCSIKNSFSNEFQCSSGTVIADDTDLWNIMPGGSSGCSMDCKPFDRKQIPIRGD